jgi:hypothetical protein
MSVTVVDLDGDLDWTEFQIPGANMPARVVTLYVERPSRARSLLVEFPEGFRRDSEGWYECAEELVVLEGGLQMSGETYGPNDWAWIPAGAVRTATVAQPRMLALARFDGPARWHQVAPPRDAELSRREQLGGSGRTLRRGDHISEWLDAPPVSPMDRDIEILGITTRTWARVPAGEPFPALEGPCFCRTFPPQGAAS